MEKLGNPVVVDIQNVADFIESHGEGHKWFPTKDFPSWLSPWPSAVYEWSSKISRLGVDDRIMAYVSTVEDDDGCFRVLVLVIGEGEVLGRRGPKWRLDFQLNRDGSLDRRYEMLCGVSEETAAVEDEYGLSPRDFYGWTCPVFLATSLLTCKNVSTRDVAPPEKLARAQLKKRGIPKVTYKVLDIDGMKRTLRTEGGSERNGLQKAMHICRGHFATYGPEHPLFGRHTGTFWKPMHVRGSAEHGAVVKDYRVRVGAA